MKTCIMDLTPSSDLTMYCGAPRDQNYGFPRTTVSAIMRYHTPMEELCQECRVGLAAYLLENVATICVCEHEEKVG